jgi:hypothetical protein
MQDPKNIMVIFIILEIFLGIMGGIFYINQLNDRATQSLMDSVFNLYLILNAIFFGITVVLGTISAIYLRKTDRLLISIMLSLAGGVLFLIIHATILSIAPFAFFSLFGFVLGFNYYLLQKPNATKNANIDNS